MTPYKKTGKKRLSHSLSKANGKKSSNLNRHKLHMTNLIKISQNQIIINQHSFEIKKLNCIHLKINYI